MMSKERPTSTFGQIFDLVMRLQIPIFVILLVKTESLVIPSVVCVSIVLGFYVYRYISVKFFNQI